MTHSLIFPVLVLSVVNLFYASIYWKWPASCNVFVKWAVGQNLLDHSLGNGLINYRFLAITFQPQKLEGHSRALKTRIFA